MNMRLTASMSFLGEVSRLARFGVLSLGISFAVSCGGGGGGNSNPHIISGSVTGLLPGNSVVLQNNGGNNTTVSANGTFAFTSIVPSGSPYAVTVSVQPPGQNCAVANGNGTVNGSNVDNVAVNCSVLSYIVSATVSGLVANADVVLQDNGTGNLAVSSNGTFKFGPAIPSGAPYSVTVFTQPVGENCAVATGSGKVANDNVVVVVACTANPYTIGGHVTGLAAGTTVVLQDNGGNNTTVSANTNFTFSAPILSGSMYSATVLTQPAGQNCSVLNGSGIVRGANISNVIVNCTSLPYTVGATVTGLANVTGLVLQDNGGDDLAVSSSGSFSFKTPVISGATYSVTILTQPAGHTCIVPNGNGTVTSSNVNIVVICPWHVGYALSGGVSAYYVDQVTGATTALPGSPFAAGNDPIAIAVSPGGGFAYVVNKGDGTVSVYAIDAKSGALSPIASSPFMAGSTPVAIAVDSNGKFAFVANSGSSDVSAFSINSSTGAFTPVPGSPFAAGGGPTLVAVDSSGNFVYAAYGALTLAGIPSTYVTAFSVDATTGALTPVVGSPFVAGSFPNALVSDPISNFLYVGDRNGYVFADAINPSTGALTPITGSPFTQGGFINSLAVDPAGKFLYVGDPFADYIVGFNINSSSGGLTFIPGSPFIVGALIGPPKLGAIDPSGHFLYCECGYLSPYAINATTGALTPFSSSPITTGNNAVPTAFSSTP